MRFDTILNRLCPDCDFDFETLETTEVTRLAHEEKPSAKSITQPILDDYDKIIWNSTPIQSLETCEQEWLLIAREKSYIEFTRQRALAYPTIGDQLDSLARLLKSLELDLSNADTEFLDAIDAVKLAIPKPE